MDETLQQFGELNVNTRLVHSELAVSNAIVGIAEQINNSLAATNPLVISILNGAVVFAGQLLPKLQFPLQQDYLHASRYGSEIEGNELIWYAYPQSSLQGRTILLLDDIFDRGFTLEAVRDYCLAKGAVQVYSAVLVEKIVDGQSGGGKSSYRPDFVGLSCEDNFVVGSGMDYQGLGRNIPGIYEITQLRDQQ